jgi:hypothetical protein
MVTRAKHHILNVANLELLVVMLRAEITFDTLDFA